MWASRRLPVDFRDSSMPTGIKIAWNGWANRLLYEESRRILFYRCAELDVLGGRSWSECGLGKDAPQSN